MTPLNPNSSPLAWQGIAPCAWDEDVFCEIDRVPKLGHIAAYAKQAMRDKLIEQREHVTEQGQDLPEIRDWKWPC